MASQSPDEMRIFFPHVYANKTHELRKLVKGGEKQGKFTKYSVATDKNLKKIVQEASTFRYSRGWPNPSFMYQSPSGRQITLPINMFKGKEQISGPVALHRVTLNGKVYLFFGDIHWSTAGECTEKKNSISIDKIIKKMVKSDSKLMPSIDFYSEVGLTTGLDLSAVEPLMRWTSKCFVAQDRYGHEFTRACGLNFRYHAADMRNLDDIDYMTTTAGRNYTPLIMEHLVLKVIKIISATGNIVRTIRDAIGAEYPMEGTEEEVIKGQEQILKIYKSDKKVRRKIQLDFLTILGLSHQFVNAFLSGRVEIDKPTEMERVFAKQIRSTDPAKVKAIMDFLLKCFILTIQTDYIGLEVYNWDLWNTIYANPDVISGFDPNDDMVERGNSRMISGDVDASAAYITIASSRLSEAEKTKAISMWVAVNKLFGDRSVLVTERTFVMDLYTLLRMERSYSKSRKLYDADGVEISEKEYKLHRPKSNEVVILYAGQKHSSRYATYFTLMGGKLETFASISTKKLDNAPTTDLVRLHDANEVLTNNLIKITDKNEAGARCLDIGRPIASLFVPDYSLNDVEVVSRTPL